MPDAEVQYQAHEFMDAATQPKSIWISPNEVYGTHALLSKYLERLVRLLDSPLSTKDLRRIQAPRRDDTLRVILTELDGVPNIGNDELTDARDAAVELRLTNRFADVKGQLQYVTM